MAFAFPIWQTDRGRAANHRALILIGDRVTATLFSWSTKSVALSLSLCQVHYVFLPSEHGIRAAPREIMRLVIRTI